MTTPDTQPVQATARVADIAAHASCMDDPLVSFRLVEAAGRSVAPAPAFLFGPSDAATGRVMFGQIETPETGCYAMADAAVAPTGIALRNGVALCGAQLNQPADHVATITSRLNGTALPVRFVPGPLVPLFGPADEAYAQLVVDYLPRLWLLHQAGYDLASLRFLVPATLPARIGAFLAHLGLPADQLVRYVHWDEVIRTDLLVLPTVLRKTERLSAGFADATRFWVRRVRDSLGLPEPVLQTRIYVAEAGGDLRAQAVAVGAGFHVLHVDEMDLPARVAAFSTASHVVGIYGAALHDSVFCAPGARVCGLRRAGRAMGFLQTGLGAALGMPTGYIFGDADADLRRGLDVLMLLG